MNLQDFDAPSVDIILKRDGYMILRDQELERRSEAARNEYKACLQRARLHAPAERFHYSDLSAQPWRKLAIGSGNGVGDPIAQNLQTTYFGTGDKNYPALGALFQTMIGIRNTLMSVDAAFGNDPERDGFWNACRVHHYPRGGGFMTIHRDEYFPGKLADKDKPFYQMLVLLSRKQVDFFTGGGVLVDFADKKVDVETEGGFGTMVFYDGRTQHGVEDIDPDQIIDFTKPDGRLAALVNLYCTT